MLTILKVPDWWFLVILAVTFTFGVVCIEIWPTELPVWGYLVALMLCGCFFVYSFNRRLRCA